MNFNYNIKQYHSIFHKLSHFIIDILSKCKFLNQTRQQAASNPNLTRLESFAIQKFYLYLYNSQSQLYFIILAIVNKNLL